MQIFLYVKLYRFGKIQPILKDRFGSDTQTNEILGQYIRLSNLENSLRNDHVFPIYALRQHNDGRITLEERSVLEVMTVQLLTVLEHKQQQYGN